MKTIIAGSRTIHDYELVKAFIESTPWNITEVVCGDARGVDSLGKRWAQENDIPVVSFPADWKKYGRRAGHIRNQEMAEYAAGLVMVWDGHSSGSSDMLVRAYNEDLKRHVKVAK